MADKYLSVSLRWKLVKEEVSKIHKIITYCFVLGFFISAAYCAENEIVTSATRELSLLGGYGITHRGCGATRTQVQAFDMILRYGHFLSDELGKGH